MALTKASELRKLTDQEIADSILEAKRKLFDLRFQQATRRLEKSHEFKHTKRRIAQLLTIEYERQLQAAKAKVVAAKEE
ncbi:MAG: 50S ribosomal protein L29 [Cyanobacteriota bacterium ELA615]|jgi:large subunit ribosomal protein L29